MRFSVFDFANYIMLTIVTLIMLYPFLNIFAVSFSSYKAFQENPLRIIPKEFNIDAYASILEHEMLYSSYLNTIFITTCGIGLSLFLYILTAYPLSKRHLKGRGFLMTMIVFTMMFNGGLIPNYLLIKELGLLDNVWSIIITGAFSGFNVILMKNFFENIPDSLEEAAKIDGANDPYILFKIIIPLSKPIIATICLYVAVAYWNNFFLAVMYIRSPEKWPLMLFLREIIMGAKMQEIASGGNTAEVAKDLTTESLQYATLLIVMVPILCVYPFLQKYFVKGIMLGSVKG